MAIYGLSELELRIAERFQTPDEMTVYEALEIIDSICQSAGEQRFLSDHLRFYYGVDVEPLREHIPHIRNEAKALLVRRLIEVETEIAERNLFTVRDALIADQFDATFVDQLNLLELARYIGMMRPILRQYQDNDAQVL